MAIAGPDPKNDAKRSAVVAEAARLFKAKKYAEAQAVLEKSEREDRWYVDKVHTRKLRLEGQLLIRLKRFDAAENANAQAFEADPTLTDAIYDNACASALQGNTAEAFKYLEVLWHVVKGAKERDRYAGFLKKDNDLRSLRKEARFEAYLSAFEAGRRPENGGFTTTPSTFALIGDSPSTGATSYVIIAGLLLGVDKGAASGGLTLKAPAGVTFPHKAAKKTLRLPVAFRHAVASRDLAKARAQGKAVDLSLKFEVLAPDGKVYAGSYNGMMNHADVRSGALLEDPAPEPPMPPPPPGSPAPETDDSVSSGDTLTDVIWFVPSLPFQVGKYRIKLSNSLYSSEYQVVQVGLEK